MILHLGQVSQRFFFLNKAQLETETTVIVSIRRYENDFVMNHKYNEIIALCIEWPTKELLFVSEMERKMYNYHKN